MRLLKWTLDVFTSSTAECQYLWSDLPLGLQTAHDNAVRPALSAILGSAFAFNRSSKVRGRTLEGLQDKKEKRKDKNSLILKRRDLRRNIADAAE